MVSQSPQYLRVADIIGDPKSNPPKPGILPISRACWWAWCKSGRAPKAIRIGRTTMWRRDEVILMIEGGR